MTKILLHLLALIGLSSASFPGSCKCTPGDSCWPSLDIWNALNASVSGKLVRNTPPAISCYPGAYYNEEECASVQARWYNSTFQSLEPIGYVYPTDDPCPPVDLSAGEKPGNCTLGPAPVYTINATEVDELVTGMKFARENNVRFVVRNTGHDLLGKSEGYGALQVWIKYMYKGILIQDTYTPSQTCKKSKWNGTAITIAGGYIWDDVYKLAFPRNLTVVGGGDPTVGCIGGYIQGGGHSPASRDYGLAADQILEAQVLLANGTTVTASPCQNSDLYFAIRGGGAGTYGIVTSATVKAYPSKPVVAQSLTISPLSDNLDSLLEAVTDIHAAYPHISDAGFSGYGTWSINSPTPFFGNSTVGYVHAIAAMGVLPSVAKTSFEAVLKTLKKYNGTSLFITVTWFEFPSYPTYYNAMSGAQISGGSANSALTSRMFDKKALTADRTALREMIGVVAGTHDESTIMSIELNGGGQVFKHDPLSGLNPAWRSAYMVEVVSRGWSNDADEETAKAVKTDISYKKNWAMRRLTPFMGSYLNEADRNDPLWATDFYGTHYIPLTMIKKKYDPEDFFYCPTCVGSKAWYQKFLPHKNYGPLCSTGL